MAAGFIHFLLHLFLFLDRPCLYGGACGEEKVSLFDSSSLSGRIYSDFGSGSVYDHAVYAGCGFVHSHSFARCVSGDEGARGRVRLDTVRKENRNELEP